MGSANVVRTVSQSLGPLLTGFLPDRKLFWVAFLGSGSFKALYDIGLLVMFKNKEKKKAREEQQAADARNGPLRDGSDRPLDE